MHDAYPRLFEPASVEGSPNPRHLDREQYLGLARAAAVGVARANGADATTVAFPDGDTFAPVRIRVGVREAVEVRRNKERRRLNIRVVAEAELAPGQPTDFAEGTTARWHTGRASRCARTSRSRSIARSARQRPTASRC
jgi:hypothetical protein